MSKFDAYSRNSWIEISADSFQKNLSTVKSMVGCKVLQVVKANAYGHGIECIARLAHDAGATYVGVATVGEAAVLRDAGIVGRIFLMATYDNDDIEWLITNQIDFSVWDLKQIEAVHERTRRTDLTAKLHLKVDTGMGRLGCFPEDASALISEILARDGIDLVGLWTHFAKADSLDATFTEQQIEQFRPVAEEASSLCDTVVVHASNSPGALLQERARFDMGRLGIVSYGISPDPEITLPTEFAPILEWKARLASVRTFNRDTPISYGGEYRTVRDGERIGIIPIGYADGFRRGYQNDILIRGLRLKTVGRICMDQCMVSLPDGIDFQVGDVVTILGRQNGEVISADDIAERWGTNAYDVVANIAPRVPRKFIEG